MKRWLNKVVSGEFARFVVVGVIATGIHYGVYLLLRLWIYVWLAYTIGYLISFCVNYLLSNYFTFRTKPSLHNGTGFLISHIVNYSLHILFLELFLYIGISDQLAPFFVYACVVPINFCLLHFFFKH